MAVIEDELTTLTPVAAVPPTETVAPERKPVPEIVIAVPPVAEPLDGATPLTVGAAFGGGLPPPLLLPPHAPSTRVRLTRMHREIRLDMETPPRNLRGKACDVLSGPGGALTQDLFRGRNLDLG